MKRNIIIFLITLVASAKLLANPVDMETARTVATNFLKTVSVNEIKPLEDMSATLPFSEFYLFSNGDGFVIVSGDDCVRPILAYSLSNQFKTDMMPINIRLWLQGYEDQIKHYKRLSQNPNASSTLRSSDDISNIVAEEWQKLLSGRAATGSSKSVVGPLLQTTWNQSPYYNNQCPYDSDAGENAVTGCTATATAQVMKYWNHPTTGYGSHSYGHYQFGTLSANFGNTTYNWSSMPNALSSTSTTAQVNAVATLMFHIGVAVEMGYGVSSSGAATVSYGSITRASAENALKTYFKYSPLLHSVHSEDYSDQQWAALLQNELNNNRPVIYTGYDTSAGHAFVCDGYNTSTGQFHFNWGWGGWCDGFYTIGQLNPASGGTGGNSSYTFNLNNSAIIGIQPNNNWNSSSIVTVTSSNTSYGTVSGGGNKPFGDTVSLLATANSGYRFEQWSDGYKYNPRQFIANGGNVTMTALFTPIAGDTITYCPGTHRVSSFGTGDNSSDAYWGIMIPAVSLTAGHDLKKVQVYITEAGSYDLTIYSGNTSNSVYTTTFTASTNDEETWKTLTLPTAVSVDGTQPLWIAFHNIGVAYPASLTYCSGNNDGLLWGSSLNSIGNSWKYTFMIRGIFQGSSTPQTMGDTLSYCADSSYSTNIGAGGNLYWGISFSPAQLAGHNSLESVLLYIVESGQYTLNIYSGTATAPTTLLRSQTYTLSNTNAYNVCSLSTPLAISQNNYLWVTFHNNTIDYPAAACNYVGDPNSDWVSTNGTSWSALHDISTLQYSWLIKCVTSQNTAAADIAIDGPTELRTGESYTFSATITGSGYSVSWNLQGVSNNTAVGTTVSAIWNNAGTYDIIATATNGNLVIKDTLTVTVTDCSAITTFPYSMGFEANEPSICWDIWTDNSDSYAWMQYNWSGGGTVAHNGSASLGSIIDNASYYNWLASPQITLPNVESATISWYDLIYAESGSGQVYQIMISTNGTTWTPLQTISYNSEEDWTQRSVSLTAYAGQSFRIAFRHTSPNDYTYVMVDDINISVTGVSLAPVTFSCTGDGNGSIRNESNQQNELCGTTQEMPSGSTLTLLFLPSAGSYLSHLYINGTDRINETSSYNSYMLQWSGTITTTTTVNAVFDLKQFEVTATSNDPSLGHVTGSGTYTYGSTATLTAVPTGSNSTFSHWSDNSTENPYSFTVTSDRSLVAYFETTESIDPSGDIDISVYPNPATSMVTISLNGINGEMTMILVDASGRTVLSRNLACDNHCHATVDVSGLSKGIYFVRLTDNNGSNTIRRLVVK